ncbi:MAG: PIN domain-containing protein [Anaerolineales bacterium]|nr:PIN domain-containing protein [Anaerolineales bacterium]
MLATFTAVYDACVLYPAPLRDLLMQLALTDLFRAKWSNAIHEEWMRGVLRNRPDLRREQLERTKELMNDHVRDSLVEDFESLIPGIQLPDLNDRHVLAAAIKARADVIVTYNLKHFPIAVLQSYGVEPQHPDEFLTHLIDLSPGIVCSAVSIHRKRLRNPSKTVEEYLDTLEQQELPRTVAYLKEFRGLL